MPGFAAYHSFYHASELNPEICQGFTQFRCPRQQQRILRSASAMFDVTWIVTDIDERPTRFNRRRDLMQPLAALAGCCMQKQDADKIVPIRGRDKARDILSQPPDLHIAPLRYASGFVDSNLGEIQCRDVPALFTRVIMTLWLTLLNLNL